MQLNGNYLIHQLDNNTCITKQAMNYMYHIEEGASVAQELDTWEQDFNTNGTGTGRQMMISKYNDVSSSTQSGINCSCRIVSGSI
jgi:hypothetical protein